ncbi:HXXEE domain-containing protein [Paenibacillus sp. J2TS4]|uniref:HXXEE domain-containing protein n=1 Tax=Paenibacillus sp. J2TS4 TaxID=2807194 RepID=UPI001B06616D|nr:HXXEE domain-containing protein [Paenibacillus sp. J2TS4]GIP31856.1 hypothetical protein J2TS4_10660 [Paenibacillus sp. J2TS4]
MIEWLDSAISTHSIIWLFLAAFMLHDFEEIICLEPWFQKHYDSILPKVPESFRSLIDYASQVKAPQFAIAVCTEFVFFIPSTWLAADYGYYPLFLGINAVMILHVFMHLGQSIYVRKLTPGVLTGAGILLPYSLYLYYRLLTENMVEWKDIFISAPFGLVLIPVVLLGHKLGEKLIANVRE